jgi:hypothetical protein
MTKEAHAPEERCHGCAPHPIHGDAPCRAHSVLGRPAVCPCTAPAPGDVPEERRHDVVAAAFEESLGIYDDDEPAPTPETMQDAGEESPPYWCGHNAHVPGDCPWAAAPSEPAPEEQDYLDAISKSRVIKGVVSRGRPALGTMQDERAPSDFADLSYHFPQLWPAPEGRTHEQVELNRTTSRPAPETMSVEEAEVSEPYCEACDETGRCRVCFDRRGIWGNREAQVSALEAALAEERQQHARLREALIERLERAEALLRHDFERALAPSEPVGGVGE